MPTPDFTLSRDAFGYLMLTVDGHSHCPVAPVRSFPISAREEGIALIGPDGSELLWIDSLADLSREDRDLILDELGSREFVPEIHRIRQVSSATTPSRWQVETDRGDTALLLKAEEDIRRLSATKLLITDANGIHFLIRDVTALDKVSRRLLDHFL